MSSILEQYRIADFLEWHHEKRLELSPDFQRGKVWTPPARTFLIDTILRKLPVPKVYLRTKVNVSTKKTIREVVDGQQRLRAILDFAEDKFVLTKRASEFAGKKYSNLNPEEQEAFLSYPIAVDQLVNASIDDVLEVFARLNSYTVSLNGPEKRHAKFQGEFKWQVRSASRKWAWFWEKYKVLTVRERVRMQDDSLTAEMMGILLQGVTDGGQPKIDAIYKKYDSEFDSCCIAKFDKVLQFISSNLAEYLVETPLMRPAHFLMLFGAAASCLVGIPKGELTEEEAAQGILNKDHGLTRENLLLLGSIIDSDEEPAKPYAEFWRTSKSSTQRIASRRVRFPVFVKAFGPEAL
jgi:hypothetical protein